MLIGMILILLAIIGGILKLVAILNADLPDWVKWMMIFRK